MGREGTALSSFPGGKGECPAACPAPVLQERLQDTPAGRVGSAGRVAVQPGLSHSPAVAGGVTLGVGASGCCRDVWHASGNVISVKIRGFWVIRTNAFLFPAHIFHLKSLKSQSFNPISEI